MFATSKLAAAVATIAVATAAVGRSTTAGLHADV